MSAPAKFGRLTDGLFDPALIIYTPVTLDLIIAILLLPEETNECDIGQKKTGSEMHVALLLSPLNIRSNRWYLNRA